MAGNDPLLLARAGTRRFAFRLADVAAVLPLPRITRPPAAAPAPLLGFADIGGRMTAVIAPAALLGDEVRVALGLDAHLLVVRTDPPVALAVDRADGIGSADGAVRPAAPEASANGWLAGEVGEGEGTHAVVRIDRLLIEAERTRFAELGRVLAARHADTAA